MKNRKKTCQLIQPQAAQVIGGISNPLLTIIAFLPKITEFKTGAAWAVGNHNQVIVSIIEFFQNF